MANALRAQGIEQHTALYETCSKVCTELEHMQEELDALQHKYRLPESLAPLTDGPPVNIHSYQR